MGVYQKRYALFILVKEETMKELYDLWFSSLEIKNSAKLELLNKYDTKEIWELEFPDLVACEIEEKDIRQILTSKNLEEAMRNLEYMKHKEIQLFSIKDEKYPQKLHHIEDKPAFLYVRGNEEILDGDNVRNGWL